MPGLADLLFLGQPDPARQIAQALNPNQAALAQGWPPAGPAQGGAGPQGGPPGAAPAPAQQQGGNPYPGSPPPPGSPPTPMAYQSSPDLAASNQTLANPPNLMSLYMQLAQRQQASDQINRGFAIIAANHSAPGMRNAIMQDAMAGSGNANEMFGNLMSIYSQQRQMEVMQQELQSAPDIAAKIGMPVGFVQGEIMAGRGSDLMRGFMPTEEMRNVQWEHDQFIKSGGTEEDWKQNYLPYIITKNMAGGNNPDMQAYRSAKIAAQQSNPNAAFPDFPTWKQVNDGQIEAGASFAPTNQAFGDLRSKTQTLQDAAKDPTGQNGKGSLDHIFNAPTFVRNAALDPTQGGIEKLLQQYGPAGLAKFGLDQNDIALLTNMSDLSKYDMGAFTARSPRNVQPYMGTIGENLKPLMNFNQGRAAWEDNLGHLADNIDTAQANLYGAMGKEAPDNLKDKVDNVFLPGGRQFIGATKPMDPSDVAAIKAMKDPAQRISAIKHLKASFYDTSPVENT
jgi:hypothetical protein